jgi:hypothetical protein
MRNKLLRRLHNQKRRTRHKGRTRTIGRTSKKTRMKNRMRKMTFKTRNRANRSNKSIKRRENYPLIPTKSTASITNDTTLIIIHTNLNY